MLGSSLINLFYLYMTIQSKIRVRIDFFHFWTQRFYLIIASCYFILSTPFDQKLGSSLLNFEDLIQKVNETICLSHFYISYDLTQIHKALFIFHMQFFQKVLMSTMCWCNSIFWKIQNLIFVSIFIYFDVKNCPVCSVGMFCTTLFTWKFFKNVLQ